MLEVTTWKFDLTMSLKGIQYKAIKYHTFSKTVYLLLNTFMRFGPL